MEKEAFYFPHFTNARHDRKIKRLRKDLGVEGYGIYFMLLETLREQNDFSYPLKDLDLLAEEFGVTEAKVKVTVTNYELFEINEESNFFSPKMLVYLEPYFRMREQRKLAGKASAEKRMLSSRSTTVQQPFNDRSTKESKVKERKVNEIKIKESFSEMILPFIEELGIDYQNFFSYWMEPDKKGKARWESEKFFDIGRRVKTWKNNQLKFKQNGNSTDKQKGTSADRIDALRNW
jgi:hypothetical protein